MTSFYTEDELFKLKEKSADENEWPTFTLNNVTVVTGDDGQVANLLEATTQRPVTIVGQLEPPGLKLRKLLLTKAPAQPWPLSIDCTHYSYGIYDNGDIDIWAAGDAGWFLINPDSTFKKTHQEMIAAVRLFYHMADGYKEDKKTSLDDILRASAKAMKMPVRRLQDLFTKYIRFFGIQMAKGAEIGSWSRTTIYQYIKEQHPEALPNLCSGPKRRAISKPKHEPEPEPARAGLRSRADIAAAKQQSIIDAGAPRKPVKTGRAARYENVSKNKVKTPEPNMKEQQATAILEAEPLWKGIQKAVKQSDFNREEATLSAVSQELLSIFDLEDEIQAADYIRLHAPGLVAIINGLTPRKDSWQKSKLWAELLSAKLSRSTAAKLRQLQIQPHNNQDLDEAMDDSDESDESNPKTPVRGKGTLRLVSGRKSAKRYTGKSKGKMRVVEADEDEDAGMQSEDDDEAGYAGVKRKAPRDGPPARKSKRLAGPFIQSESDEEEAEEGEDELHAMDGAADDNDATSHTVDAIPFKKDLLLGMNIDMERGPSGDRPVPSLLSRPDQSMDPDDPSDVWHCKHDGCMFTVYGASKEKNQGMIREHLDSHDNVIKAVLGEQAMTHKPVGNLLRLLREKAGGYPEALSMLEGNPMGFPAPVATMM